MIGIVQLSTAYTPTREATVGMARPVISNLRTVDPQHAPVLKQHEIGHNSVVWESTAKAVCSRNHWSVLTGGALADLHEAEQERMLRRAGLPVNRHNSHTRGLLGWHSGSRICPKYTATVTASHVTALAALGNGQSAVGCRNGTVLMFDSRSQSSIDEQASRQRPLFEHSGAICALASPDWEAGQIEQTIRNDRRHVPTTLGQTAVATQLVCKSMNDELKLWDLRYTSRPLVTFRHYKNRDEPSNHCLAFFGFGTDADEGVDVADWHVWQPELYRGRLEVDNVQPEYRCRDPLENSVSLWRDGAQRNVVLTEVAHRRALGVHSMDGESYTEIDLPCYAFAPAGDCGNSLPDPEDYARSNTTPTRPLDDICVSFGRVYTSHGGVVQEWAL